MGFIKSKQYQTSNMQVAEQDVERETVVSNVFTITVPQVKTDTINNIVEGNNACESSQNVPEESNTGTEIIAEANTTVNELVVSKTQTTETIAIEEEQNAVTNRFLIPKKINRPQELPDIKPWGKEGEEKISFIQSFKATSKYLSDHNINYFNNYNPDVQDDIIKIAYLKNDINSNLLNAGKILIKYKETKSPKDYKYFLLHPMVDLKRTQAQKLIDVYKYIVNKRSGRLTGIQIRLGIEKLHCISRIENEEYYEILENFVADKQITVKILKLIIENIKQNVGITVEDAYQKTLEFVKNKEANKQSQVKTYTQVEVDKLQKKIKQLEADCLALKAKLNQQENKGINDVNDGNNALEHNENVPSVNKEADVQNKTENNLPAVTNNIQINHAKEVARRI